MDDIPRIVSHLVAVLCSFEKDRSPNFANHQLILKWILPPMCQAHRCDRLLRKSRLCPLWSLLY